MCQSSPLAHNHGKTDDGIIRRLPMHLGEHDIGLSLGKKAASLDGRQLRWISQHKNRLAKGEKIAPQSLINHRAFVYDDQARISSRAMFIDDKGRLFTIHLFGAIDQAVNGSGVCAAFGAQHKCSLARVSGEQNIA